MKLYIDATNIRAGGGVTHLKNILYNFQGEFDEVIVVGGKWINSLPSGSRIRLKEVAVLNGNFLLREIFKFFFLGRLFQDADLVFVPGTTFSSKKISYVVMPQNMLVFEEEERARFPSVFDRFRYFLLEKRQVRSMEASQGIIFISQYARDYIRNKHPKITNIRHSVVYHGIHDKFRFQPRKKGKNKTVSLLYVSIVNHYKFQWNVIDAVDRLNASGYHVQLTLIGPIEKSLRKYFMTKVNNSKHVNYQGYVPHDEIAYFYEQADMFIFASTCENMPNILVEAMGAGLPIVCSNKGPMPEILGDAGIYIDPLSVDSIELGIKKFLGSDGMRMKYATSAYESSMNFTWEKCARETFSFLSKSVSK